MEHWQSQLVYKPTLVPAILGILGIVLVTFLMLHIIAPSPALTILGAKATPAAIKSWNHEHGFDRSVYAQFGEGSVIPPTSVFDVMNIFANP